MFTSADCERSGSLLSADVLLCLALGVGVILKGCGGGIF